MTTATATLVEGRRCIIGVRQLRSGLQGLIRPLLRRSSLPRHRKGCYNSADSLMEAGREQALVAACSAMGMGSVRMLGTDASHPRRLPGRGTLQISGKSLTEGLLEIRSYDLAQI